MATPSRREIRALISLLDDENAFVREKVTERLRELGMRAVPLVEEELRGANISTRQRARSIIEMIRRDALAREFAALTASSAFDLERGMFLLARTAYPHLDEDRYRARLDAFAQAVRERLAEGFTPHRIVRCFSEVLYGEGGLRGNSDDYYDPDNSYINRVLDRRLGIPVSLSAIGLLVAERVGLPFVGVGMPTHFLLAYETGGARILLDPFNGGKIVTKEECRARLESLGVQWQEDHLKGVSARYIMFRILVNLILIYQHRQDGAQVDLLGRMVASIQRSTTQPMLPPG